MSQDGAAEICIGGDVRRSLACRLAKALCSEGASVEWGDPPVRPASARDLAALVNRKSGLLVLRQADASWGCFRNLESLLVDLGIAFDRLSDPVDGSTTDGEVVKWRPGMLEPNVYLGSTESGVLVPADAIVKTISEYEGEDLARRLRELAGADVPDLQPFRVVADRPKAGEREREADEAEQEDQVTKPSPLEWSVEAGDSGVTYHETRIDFGFRDEKGRAVGCLLVIEEVPAHSPTAEQVARGWSAPAYPAHIETRVYSTRDGSKFGAIPRAVHHAAGDVDAAKASLAQRAEVSARRQRKVHGGGRD